MADGRWVCKPRDHSTECRTQALTQPRSGPSGETPCAMTVERQADCQRSPVHMKEGSLLPFGGASLITLFCWACETDPVRDAATPESPAGQLWLAGLSLGGIG